MPTSTPRKKPSAPARPVAKASAKTPVIARKAKPYAGFADIRLHRLVRDYAPHDVMDRIAIVRRGIPATAVTVLVDALSLSKEQLAAGIAIPVPTLNRKLRAHTTLSATESERVAGLMQLMSTVEQWTAALGSSVPAGFVPMTWLGRWLTTPNPALGGVLPLNLLDTADGRALVGSVLGSLESGAYW